MGSTPPRLHLLVADLPLLDAAVRGDDELASVLGGCRVARDWQAFPDAVRRLRDDVAANAQPPRWGSRLFVHDAPRVLVGWGGFKGPPRDGSVEIGYAVAPDWQGRGLATCAVLEMLREAYAAPEVEAVIAHTLPERNASVRVLEKAGFRRDGGVQSDGERSVWRFRHMRTSQSD
jgi:ribosomal-protein-alanine N-acetyltransferase